ncbi:hypothetical protein RF11_01492 [Thelohanellus kitauei]|uniref:DUF4704 domain-containing protein n=1 Tax=Thelohanellus kitauei TaxID=669202 RepID=A0A0C2MCV2_THEKT|nr:hypothetical protein RF11_01492 [Thelohanellus kitauei]
MHLEEFPKAIHLESEKILELANFTRRVDSEYMAKFNDYRNETYGQLFYQILEKQIYRNDFKEINKQEPVLRHIFNFITRNDHYLNDDFYSFLDRVLEKNRLNKFIIYSMINPDTFIRKFIQTDSHKNQETKLESLCNQILTFSASPSCLELICQALDDPQISIAKKCEILRFLTGLIRRNDVESYFHFVGELGSAIYIYKYPNNLEVEEYTITSCFNIRDFLYRQKIFDHALEEHTTHLIGRANHYLRLFFKPCQICIEISDNKIRHKLYYDVAVNPEAWHHLALIQSKYENKVGLSLVLDGNFIGTSIITPINLNDICTKLVIGKTLENDEKTQFIGSIANLQIWSMALNLNELETLRLTWFEKANLPLQSVFEKSHTFDSYLQSLIIDINPQICTSNLRRSDDSRDLNMFNFDIVYSDDVLNVKRLNNITLLKIDRVLNIANKLFDEILNTNEDYLPQINRLLIMLVDLIGSLLAFSSDFMQSICKNQIYRVWFYKISEIKPKYLSNELLKCLFEWLKNLIKGRNLDIFKHMILECMLNRSSWNQWPIYSKEMILVYLQNEDIDGYSFCRYLKESGCITYLFDLMNEIQTISDSKSSDINLVEVLYFNLIKCTLIEKPEIAKHELDILIDMSIFSEKYFLKIVKIVVEVMGSYKSYIFKIIRNKTIISILNRIAKCKDSNSFKILKNYLSSIVDRCPKRKLLKLVKKHKLWFSVYLIFKNECSVENFDYLINIMIERNKKTNTKKSLSETNFAHTNLLKIIVLLIENAFEKCHQINLDHVISKLLNTLDNELKESKESRKRLYLTEGWQVWILVLSSFYQSNDHKNIKMLTFSIILQVILTAFKEYDNGWISFMDCLGVLDFTTSQKTFLTLERNTYDDASNKNLGIVITDHNLLNNCPDVGRIDNFGSLNQNELVSEFIYMAVKRFTTELANLQKIDSLDAFTTFFKNICSVVYLIGDLIANWCLSIDDILPIFNLNVTEFINEEHQHNCALSYNILTELKHLSLDIFNLKPTFRLEVSEIIDFDHKELIEVIFRICLVKYLIDSLIKSHKLNICKSEKVINGGYESVPHENSKINPNGTRISHEQLLSTEYFDMFETFFSCEIFRNDVQREILQTGVYVLYKMFLWEYAKIFNSYDAQESNGKSNISSLIIPRLKNLANLLYKTFIEHMVYFNKIFTSINPQNSLDFYFKNMKIKFESLEFIMMMNSNSWTSIIEEALFDTFKRVCRKSLQFQSRIIHQIHQRNILASRLYNTVRSEVEKVECDFLNLPVQENDSFFSVPSNQTDYSAINSNSKIESPDIEN